MRPSLQAAWDRRDAFHTLDDLAFTAKLPLQTALCLDMVLIMAEAAKTAGIFVFAEPDHALLVLCSIKGAFLDEIITSIQIVKDGCSPACLTVILLLQSDVIVPVLEHRPDRKEISCHDRFPQINIQYQRFVSAYDFNGRTNDVIYIRNMEDTAVRIWSLIG